jgi:hypothetical protein
MVKPGTVKTVLFCNRSHGSETNLMEAGKPHVRLARSLLSVTPFGAAK